MGFDECAGNWDTVERIERAKIVANEILSSIDIDENCTAMEFGCGTGLVSFNLIDKFKHIALIDSSKGMIDILNSKISSCKANNMTTYELELTDESMLDIRFDVIYNSMVLHHVQDTKAIIKNFYELLNDEGYLCIVDLDEEDGSFHKEYSDFDGHNGFNQVELKSVLVDAGFKDIVSNTFFFDVKIIEDESINYSLFLMKARKYTNN